MKSSLDYSRRALGIATSQIHFKFNIAFVQIQLAQLIYTLPESQRTLTEVQAASEGLDDAIESFTEIAQSKNPPYPKHDIEQRANMGRNTMRRQLERAIQSQREYEEKNAARLQEAREAREAEMKRREEERKKAEETAAEEKKKIQEERNEILALNRELVEKRAEEERRKEELEYTTDSETGERVKRKKKPRAAGGKRKKKGEESDSETEGEGSRRRRKGAKATEDETSGITSMDEHAPRTKKKRKLARKGGKEDKFKSSEMVVDSDEDDDVAPAATTNGAAKTSDPEDDVDMDDAGPATEAASRGEVDEDEEAVPRPRKKPVRRIEESDEEDEEDEEDGDDEAPTPMTTAEKAAAEGRGEDVSKVEQRVMAAGGGNDVEVPGQAGEVYPGVIGAQEADA